MSEAVPVNDYTEGENAQRVEENTTVESPHGNRNVRRNLSTQQRSTNRGGNIKIEYTDLRNSVATDLERIR